MPMTRWWPRWRPPPIATWSTSAAVSASTWSRRTWPKVAAAWAAGLNPAMIARALTTFAADEQMVPGRFNTVEIAGVEIILDYGHNTAAVAALGQAVTAMGQRRTVLVAGLPGDRRDADLCAT